MTNRAGRVIFVLIGVLIGIVCLIDGVVYDEANRTPSSQLRQQVVAAQHK